MSTIFKKIIDKEIPAHIIYEDSKILAFLDAFPATLGHTLIIPKVETKNFLTVEQETLTHMIKVSHQLGNHLVTKLNAKGLNILSNANEAAGQTVMHFHIHLIPRYDENDGFNFSVNTQKLDLQEVQNTIKGFSLV